MTQVELEKRVGVRRETIVSEKHHGLTEVVQSNPE
jgi:DNA-binding XRE family transcriptional regulator